ncbi:hypothetical protein [Sporosarcina limicola]|uniref:Uncharacterized protein n=1 Tax=Sporosarcina limicola TaxID=34101 RepID=A0A927R4D9_9BACL|nr:hypothetical protein [Sporosarcina limicola]MBE1554778.1 hypothetical protein [Sporosarcina limicola]
MTRLTVIDGIKKEKPDYFSLYSTAFINTFESAVEQYSIIKKFDLDTRRKLVWSGVKMINASKSRSKDRKGLEIRFGLISTIKAIASGLTPREFQTVFPIEKSYNGEKYEMKDYFYTKKYIEEFGEDKIIGEDIEEFLMEYDNWTVRFFMVGMMSVASDIRRMEGGKGLAEEFFEDQGITTYTMTEDDKGKQILINNDTGEVQKVRKPRPRWLKVVK